MTYRICISDVNGAPLPYANYLLEALVFFPMRDGSFEQARLLIADEYLRFKQVGSRAYRPSKLLQAVTNSARKRSQQVHVAGLVALAMFGLASVGKRASQDAACAMVSKLTSSNHKEPFVFLDPKKQTYFERYVSVPNDPDSIRQIFKEHRALAHVCAARIVANDYLKPLPMFEEAIVAHASLLRTVFAFQGFFVTHFAENDWELRLIDYPRALPTDFPHLEPLHDRMEMLMQFAD